MADIFFYGNFLIKALNKEIDFNSDTIKCMLCSSTYTQNQDTHAYKSDITNEITGTGYVAGGTTMTNCTMTYDSDNKKIVLDADNITWNPSTITNARYGVIYDSTPSTDATRPLIAYIDLISDKSSLESEFTINFGEVIADINL
jgi:NAD(P)H-hydrate repair Nnr-like enzyme with NAD(P)H-hydrate dehydratase domain